MVSIRNFASCWKFVGIKIQNYDQTFITYTSDWEQSTNAGNVIHIHKLFYYLRRMIHGFLWKYFGEIRKMKQTLLLWSGDSFALNISALVFQTGVVFFGWARVYVGHGVAENSS